MKISFLGGGNMAAALIGGLLKQGFAAQDMQVADLSEQARAQLTSTFGVRAVAALDETALACDVLVLAVKPQHMRAALAPLAGKLSTQVVVSIAAGLRLQDLSRWLGGYQRLVRAMPNTPALIGMGVTGLYAEPILSATEREAAERVLAAVGRAVWVATEADIDAVTAISGSGPAYLFYFIECLQAAGEALGLSADNARILALDTVAGAAQLAACSDASPAVLRERVTSKGGTTEAALASMRADDLPALIARATQAAAARGQELGVILGQDEAS